MAPPSPLPWRFQISSTVKGIFLLRYLLFSGGLAAGLAVFLRAITGAERPTFGLLLGLGLGLAMFRDQLRVFSLPVLALGRDNLLFIRRREAVPLAWWRVREVTVRGQAVVLEVFKPAAGPEGATSREVQLQAPDFGVDAPRLAELLGRLRDPALREALPADEQIRRWLGVKEEGASR